MIREPRVFFVGLQSSSSQNIVKLHHLIFCTHSLTTEQLSSTSMFSSRLLTRKYTDTKTEQAH